MLWHSRDADQATFAVVIVEEAGKGSEEASKVEVSLKGIEVKPLLLRPRSPAVRAPKPPAKRLGPATVVASQVISCKTASLALMGPTQTASQEAAPFVGDLIGEKPGAGRPRGVYRCNPR